MSWYVFKKMLLNDGEPQEEVSPQEMAARLKSAMDNLRGTFFEAGTGRIAYERIQQSESYQAYLKLSNNLKTMDLRMLARREERIAFWINLYNVIVIHGVIALGVKDSVKEVWNFFRRVYYQVGRYFFSPDDIEHGILRGNRRPPYSLFRPFRAGDPRLDFIVEPLDPRIHFTLVCGSASCPFIDVYTPENLEVELTIAAQAFINSGGVVLDRSQQTISLSRIFKWYAGDFGATQVECLRFIAFYLDKEQDRTFIEEHANRLKVTYQNYDWRLNRY
ncbi:MAG: DUF547 domain-containing protein [Deltaproteobacteria bacterium]|nr:DUF547 domain-containing protein [Deltaproteobacteria bacterium]